MNDDRTLVPSVTEPSDLRVHRNRPARRPWYRCKLVLIPLVVLLFLVGLAGGLYLKIEDRFDTINSLSTPPPMISGEQLGGDESLTVDTGPAMEAVRRRHRRRHLRATPPRSLGTRRRSFPSATGAR